MNQTNRIRREKKRLEHWEIIALYLVLYDIVAINFAYFLGLWMRFDFQFSHVPTEYLTAYLKFAPIYTVVSLLVFKRLHLYNSLWRFASFTELNRIMAASMITTVFHMGGITALFQRMPPSHYMMGAILQVILLTMVRFAYRYINLERNKRAKNNDSVKHVMVIGAGAAG